MNKINNRPIRRGCYWWVRLPGGRKWHLIPRDDVACHVVNGFAFDGRVVRLGTREEAASW